MLQHRLLLFALALLIAMDATARKSHPPPAPLAPESLSVEGTAFVYHAPDGKTLRGVELAGHVLELDTEDGGKAMVKIDSVKPDANDKEILRHEFLVRNEKGHWKPYCAPNFYGETWGIPIALPKGHPGRLAAVTMTCSAGAIVMCVRFGYKPWAKGANGEDMAPYHAACMHMVRADYCGTGDSNTKDGTMMQVYDRAGVRPALDKPDPDHVFEAGWGPSGAVCVARNRRDDVTTLDSLHERCPSLPIGDDCTEETAAAGGALVFDRLRAEP